MDGACRISKAGKGRREKALEGLAKILGREAHLAEKELTEAIEHSEAALEKLAQVTGVLPAVQEEPEEQVEVGEQMSLDGIEEKKSKKEKRKGK